MRIGHGYDVHRLVAGRKLVLGGVDIPYEMGLLGHSDADVLTHAVMDSLLGAAGLGDIGRHFPDSDELYKGISSLELLAQVRDMLEEKCYVVENIDVTVIAQRPKLAGYIDGMVRNLAQVLGIDVGCVNVKATTEEGLGFTGTGEGIACHAVSMLCGLRDAWGADAGRVAAVCDGDGLYQGVSGDGPGARAGCPSCAGCSGCAYRGESIDRSL
ncbi:MAG: 2-C-methyl-D-erythritol 2,4-cyclodiphosphate synthase [Lachnospiraceae bacterium]|jgi:2-C-methyl-D-erythritol 2,4-cyclodiphosphate synthase|nr:2-C-methyl-D-erythritol 2,4-cyclodiphosphate synthase [Lachnospiraceae bacterium]